MKKSIAATVIFYTVSLASMELDLFKISSISPEQWEEQCIENNNLPKKYFCFNSEKPCLQCFPCPQTVQLKNNSSTAFFPHQMSIGLCIAQLWMLISSQN